MNRTFLTKYFCVLSFTFCFAQQQDSTETKSTTTTILDSVIAESSSKLMLDAKEPLIIEESQKKFNLKDMQKAYTYDSLWLAKLHESRKLFFEMDSILHDKSVLANSELNENYNKLPTDTLKARLAYLNARTPFNIEYNPHLESVINYFLKKKRPLMEKMLTVSQFYFPLFEQELDNYDLPLELKYLAIVESALNPKARSRVGAKGLWQFMFATGKQYGLDVSSYVDERNDPILATKSACEYLGVLHSIFGDWDLALAAYNSGPGNVNKAIRRSGGYRNYWNLRMFLPRETAGYVPSFLATMYLFEYADEHGLKKELAERPYFETDTVHVKQTISFNQIQNLLGISVEELEELNPAYKLNVIPKVDGKNYALRLPRKYLGEFVSNEEAIYAFVAQENKKQEKPLPELVEAPNSVRYKVKSGDYLGKIAERYGVGVSQIKRWNGMRSNNLKIGQRLTIYPRKPIVAKTTTSRSNSNTRVKIILPSDPSKIHVVESGDSLWTISRKYPGISIDNLRKWNGLENNKLKPGTKLRLCDCSS